MHLFLLIRFQFARGLSVGFFLTALVSYPTVSLALEQGPFLERLLTEASSLGYSVTIAETSISPQTSSNFIKINGKTGKEILTFNYQHPDLAESALYKERLLNFDGDQWPLVRELLENSLPLARSPVDSLKIFLRSIDMALSENKLIAFEISSLKEDHQSMPQSARLFLSLSAPISGESLYFLPQDPLQNEAVEDIRLPLIVVELDSFVRSNPLQYLRYLVPVRRVIGSETFTGINMETVLEHLQGFRRFTLVVDVNPSTTTLFPALYDGKDLVGDIGLEIYALSNYVRGFLDCYVPTWAAEYPKYAHTIQLKRSITDAKFFELDIDSFRSPVCQSHFNKELSTD